MKVIYDIGANNGDDIPYYLLKADRVVAVEANPVLCRQIRDRFGEDLASSRLVLEECVITSFDRPSEVEFWVHNDKPARSQYPTPPKHLQAEFTKHRLPSRPVADIIVEHGDPYYVKIDIEGFDAQVLRALFTAGIRPPYISAECHHCDVIAVLIALGGYTAFQIVDGESVVDVFRNALIHTNAECVTVNYSFPFHTSGPFGDDLRGEWMTADRLLAQIVTSGFGWKDVHATTLHEPTATAAVKTVDLLRMVAARMRRAISKRISSLSRVRRG